jgi:hypothetical protein
VSRNSINVTIKTTQRYCRGKKVKLMTNSAPTFLTVCFPLNTTTTSLKQDRISASAESVTYILPSISTRSVTIMFPCGMDESTFLKEAKFLQDHFGPYRRK